MDNETEGRLIENQLLVNSGNKLRDAARNGDAEQLRGVFWILRAALSDLTDNPNVNDELRREIGEQGDAGATNERRRDHASKLRDIAWDLMCMHADIGALSPSERAELSKASYAVEAIYQKVRWNAENQELAA